MWKTYCGECLRFSQSNCLLCWCHYRSQQDRLWLLLLFSAETGKKGDVPLTDWSLKLLSTLPEADRLTPRTSTVTWCDTTDEDLWVLVLSSVRQDHIHVISVEDLNHQPFNQKPPEIHLRRPLLYYVNHILHRCAQSNKLTTKPPAPHLMDNISRIMSSAAVTPSWISME